MLEYKIRAVSETGGKAVATANKLKIDFDATSGRDDELPNPAELLLTALAACILKNIQRYSEMLHFTYRKARIVVHGVRNDHPPFMSEINYKIEIDTDISEQKINNLHKNIKMFGTITNTLAKACTLTGTIEKRKMN